MKEAEESKSPLAKAIAGIGLRSIGPAFMGGRIADIAIHPDRPSVWYVAVGSGGVWKTPNAGITWEPLFDDQPSYSIGCVRIDPSRPEVIWVGTGEDVSGRHVAWGDGVYRSPDGGKTWTQMGLANSEHISDILIDPQNSDVVFVAAEGPLWKSGGDRGLYKTADGGKTWNAVLSIDEDTGVTSAVFAPGDPNTIYAASYQRRRRVWSFQAGGPGSGIHRSTDGGTTWTKITEGLPEGDMGRIGLAVTPAAPELVYATIEAAEEKERGFYRSTTKGASWERRSEYLSGGTGPHYYQKIFASPTNSQRVYQADVFVHATNDGGKTFVNIETGKGKHSDNHVVWIDPTNPDHLLVGSDAGLYESFDDGGFWRHVSNMPISQFYKVAVDNSVPFTTILAGAQDLGTLRGPTRTLQLDGVRNQDWWVPLGADGYHVAFDPEDNDISYLEWQVGNVMRHDGRTMELTDIQPQPGPDDPPERWNWEVPIVISPHQASRIYLGSQRLWRSEDRGDSWSAISPDLTTNVNRYELAVADRVLSVDSLYDHEAMSLYCSITAIAESPVDSGVLYVGTDDGRIQVSDNGGETWREATRPDGLPEAAFINDFEASAHDGNAVIVAADDHKSGDYRPYLFESLDRGRTWIAISSNIADGVIVWSIEQDHIVEDLLFIGAENGVYVSLNRGQEWHKLSKNVPTISFRDMAIQRRDDDLICASFGRGVYVLDDYGPLRELAASIADDGPPAVLLPVRDAWWYVPYQPMQAVGQSTLGATAFRTPNPDFGATFTYHLQSEIESPKAARKAAEKKVDGDIEFPGWDRLNAEHVAPEPALAVLISDTDGNAVATVAGETSAGLHRTTWDLRLNAPEPVRLKPPDFEPPWASSRKGPLVTPGRYRAELVSFNSQGLQVLAGPQEFSVVPIPAVQPSAESGQARDFRQKSGDLARRYAGASKRIESARDRIKHLRIGVVATAAAAGLYQRLEAANSELEELAVSITGDPVRTKLAEAAKPAVGELIERIKHFQWDNTASPTATQLTSLGRASAEFETAEASLITLIDSELAAISAALDAAGGPYTPR